MLTLDGAEGEGGGQIIRTALTLAAITQRAVRIENIRAHRPNPGLAPQHLTVVRALATLTGAQLQGASLHSTSLTFLPTHPTQPGDHVFDVAAAAHGGSAGSVALLFQALWLPLALANGVSHLTLRGGTHVQWSPPAPYLQHVFLPAVGAPPVDIALAEYGFYPAGGGEVSVTVTGPAAFHPLNLTERGPLRRVWGEALAANLPADIPQRIANRARNRLTTAGLAPAIEPKRVRSAGPGVALVLLADYDHTRTGVIAFGKKGKPSQVVADEAVDALLAYHHQDRPVDRYLADQLLLPLALAGGRSHLRIAELTQHTRTNAAIIRRFLPVQITINGDLGHPAEITIQPTP